MLDEKAIFATTNLVATLSLRTYGTAVFIFLYLAMALLQQNHSSAIASYLL